MKGFSRLGVSGLGKVNSRIPLARMMKSILLLTVDIEYQIIEYSGSRFYAFVLQGILAIMPNPYSTTIQIYIN